MPKKKEHKEKIKAIREFTDRKEPQEAFWQEYEIAKKKKDEYFLLNYYGIGGIGKSELLSQIRTTFIEEIGKEYILKFDFEDSTDFYYILLSWRTQLINDYKEFKFPNFEFACFCYAQMIGVNSGIELRKSVLERHPGFKSATSLVDIFYELCPGFKVLGPSPSTIVQAGAGIIDQIEESITEAKKNKIRNELTECRKIEEKKQIVVEYFFEDLKECTKKLDKPLVVFLDTYEELSQKRTSNYSSTDDWLKDSEFGIIANSENVLWVIFGRNKLKFDWVEMGFNVLPAGKDLTQVDNPDQYVESKLHCLGNLEESDTYQFLRTAGIPEDCYLDIYKVTEGNPLWLDVVVDTYEKAINNGKEFNFSGIETTDKLLERYLKYMSYPEQDAVRFLSILGTWTTEALDSILENKIIFSAYDEIINACYITRVNNTIMMHHQMRESIYKAYSSGEHAGQIRDCCEAARKYYEEKMNETVYPSSIYLYYLKRLIDIYSVVKEADYSVPELLKYVERFKEVEDYKSIEENAEIIEYRLKEKLKEKEEKSDYEDLFQCQSLMFDVKRAVIEHKKNLENKKEKLQSDDDSLSTSEKKIGVLIDDARCFIDELCLKAKEKESPRWKLYFEKKADFLAENKNYTDAIESYRTILDGKNKNDARLNNTYLKLSGCYYERGMENNCAEDLIEAAKIKDWLIESIFYSDSTNTTENTDDIHTEIERIVNIADSFTQQMNFQVALASYKKAYGFCVGNDEMFVDMISIIEKWAFCLKKQGDYSAAERKFNEEYEYYKNVYDEMQPQMVDCLVNIADVRFDKGLYDDAMSSYEKAVNQFITFYGRPYIKVLMLEGKICDCYVKKSNYINAIEKINEIICIFNDELDSNNKDMYWVKERVENIVSSFNDKRSSLSDEIIVKICKKIREIINKIFFDDAERCKELNDIIENIQHPKVYEEEDEITEEDIERMLAEIKAEYEEAAKKEEEKKLDSIEIHDVFADNTENKLNMDYCLKEYESRLKTLGQNNPITLEYQSKVATRYFLDENYSESYILHNDVYSKRRSLLGKYNFKTLISMFQLLLTEQLQNGKEITDADIIDSYDKLINDAKIVLGETNNSFVVIIQNLAFYYYKKGLYEKEREILLWLYDLEKEIHSNKLYTITDGYYALSDYYINNGKLDFVVDWLKILYERYVNDYNQDTAGAIQLLNKLAYFEYDQKNYEQSIDDYQTIYNHEMKICVNGKKDTLITPLHNIGAALFMLGRVGDALDKFNEAYELRVRYQEKDTAGIALTDFWRARCYQSFGEYSRALAVFENVLPIFKEQAKINKKRKKTVCDILFNIGICHINMDNKDKAREFFNMAYQERRNLLSDTHPDTIAVKEELDKLDYTDE